MIPPPAEAEQLQAYGGNEEGCQAGLIRERNCRGKIGRWPIPGSEALDYFPRFARSLL